MSISQIRGIVLIVVILAFSSEVAGLNRFFLGKDLSKSFEERHIPEDRLAAYKAAPLPAKWFTQTLDHFDSTNNGTWQQRYYVNNQYYRPGGPVFLYIGGEGPETGAFLVEGAIVDYAKSLGALMVDLEHRFYGASSPTNHDISTENLKYLSSEQALADLDNFQTHIIQTLDIFPATPWVSFGGSYPGCLSAWYRLKYPHKVIASIASSAPVQAELDFSQYLEVVQNSLQTDGSPLCVQKVANATATIQQMLTSPSGLTQLSQMFNTCKPLTTNKEDVATFMSTIAGFYMGTVQYNDDHPGSTDIGDLCNIMTKASDVVQGTVAVAHLVNGDQCLDVAYEDTVNQLKTTTDDNQMLAAARLWTWQSCREFGFFQSSDSTKQPFGDLFPIKYWTQMCADVFGEQFDSPNIDWTLSNYGGKKYAATNVAFVNGLIDPWHALSIVEDNGNENITRIVIPSGAHCQNMEPPNPADKPDVIAARKQIMGLLTAWVKGAEEEN